MKKMTKFLMLLFCGITVFSMTSCLNDSDDDGYVGIDPTTYANFLASASGNYNVGTKLYFYNDTITAENNKSMTDSIMGLRAVIAKDSSLVLYDVPGRVLAKEIKNNEPLKMAIEEAEPVGIVSKILFYNITQGYGYYYVYSSSVIYNNLEFNGGKHKVELQFYIPSGGLYYNKQTTFTYCLSNVKVDDKNAYQIYDGSNDAIAQRRAVLQFVGSKY